LIRDETRLLRIRRLAIPPAYRQVWICPLSNGHIQATGRDDRGRKQYRYHERWRSIRDENKYDRILVFAAALPKIRQRVESGLKVTGAHTGEDFGHGGSVAAKHLYSRRQRRVCKAKTSLSV